MRGQRREDGHADGDIDLGVYDGLAGFAVASSTTTTDNEHVAYVAPATGPLYVRVSLSGRSSSNVCRLGADVFCP